MWKEGVIRWCVSIVCFSLFYNDSPDQRQLLLCLISIIHSMTLLLWIQSRSLLMWRVGRWWFYDLVSFVCLFFFFLSSRLSSSIVSVVFVLSASLSDVAPVFPIQLSFYVAWIENGDLLMGVFCVSSFIIVFTTQMEFSECCIGFQ